MEINNLRYYTACFFASLLIAWSIFCGMVDSIAPIGQIGKPFPGFQVLGDGVCAQSQLFHWTGYKENLKWPMKVIEVNGKPYTNLYEFKKTIADYPAGTEIKYKIYTGLNKGIKEISIPTMEYTLKDYLMGSIPRFIGYIIVWICGIWVFILRPNSSKSWGVLMFCIGYPFVLQVTYDVDIFHGTWLPDMIIVSKLFFTQAGAWIFHLIVALLNEPEYMKKKPWLYSLYYLPALLIVFLNFYSLQAGNYALHFIIWNYLCTAYIGFAAAFGGIKCGYLRYTSQNPLVRQQARVLLLGYFVAAFLTVSAVYAIALGYAISLAIIILPTLIYPVTITYASLRYDLLGVSDIVRRSVVYGTMLIITAAVYAGLFWFSSEFFAVFIIKPQNSMLFIILSLFLLLLLKHRIQNVLDRLFLKIKVDYNRMTESIKKEVIASTDMSSVIRSVNRIIREGFLLTNMDILLRSEKTEEYVSTTGMLRIAFKEEIVKLLRIKRMIISFNEIEDDPIYHNLKNRCLAQMASIESAYIFPIFFRRKMIGIMALGSRMSAEGAFDRSDIEFLHYAANQVGIAVENSRLYISMQEAAEEMEKLNVILEYRVEERSSELKAKGIKLLEANQRIASETKYKSEFLASMSHELKTPLIGILGYAELLIGGKFGSLTDIIIDTLKDLYKNGNELLDKINSILDFSRIEAGSLVIKAEAFSPREIVDRAVFDWINDVNIKGMSIKGEFERNTKMVWGNAKRVMWVLSNLIRNAARFSGGTTITVRVKPDGGVLYFEVEDDGIGIPEHRIAHIFEEFQMPSSVKLANYQGIGLGLALSKKLVELMGGNMDAESRIGKGSKFRFSLPAVSMISERGEEKEGGVDVIEYHP